MQVIHLSCHRISRCRRNKAIYVYAPTEFNQTTYIGRYVFSSMEVCASAFKHLENGEISMDIQTRCKRDGSGSRSILPPRREILFLSKTKQDHSHKRLTGSYHRGLNCEWWYTCSKSYTSCWWIIFAIGVNVVMAKVFYIQQWVY